MIEFVCDSCLKVKDVKDTWILGYAAESLGVTAEQREITILPAWDLGGALHPLAVHFCSERCKNDYRAKLFGPEGDLKAAAPRTVTLRSTSRVRTGKSRKTQRRKSAA